MAGEDEPRSTMPIRGLKNTLPLHWDGNLGDPFGGGNGDVGVGGSGRHRLLARRTSTATTTASADLVPASLSGVMCDQTPSCAAGRPARPAC